MGDIDAAVAYPRARDGVRTLGPVAAAPEGLPIAGLTDVFFTSPWGLLIELVQRPEHLPYEATTTARYWGPAPTWDANATG